MADLKKINVNGIEIPINEQLTKVHFASDYSGVDEEGNMCRFYGLDLSDIFESPRNLYLHEFVVDFAGVAGMTTAPSYKFVVVFGLVWNKVPDGNPNQKNAEIYLWHPTLSKFRMLHINGLGKVFKETEKTINVG